MKELCDNLTKEIKHTLTTLPESPAKDTAIGYYKGYARGLLDGDRLTTQEYYTVRSLIKQIEDKKVT